MPFYEKRGIVAHGYGELVWRYIVMNRKPHTLWEEVPAGAPVPTE